MRNQVKVIASTKSKTGASKIPKTGWKYLPIWQAVKRSRTAITIPRDIARDTSFWESLGIRFNLTEVMDGMRDYPGPNFFSAYLRNFPSEDDYAHEIWEAIAFATPRNESTLLLLLEKRKLDQLQFRTSKDENLIRLVMRRDLVRSMLLLLRKGMRPSMMGDVPYDGGTLLRWAIEDNAPNCFDALLANKDEFNLDVHWRGPKGNIVHSAVSAPQCLEKLLRRASTIKRDTNFYLGFNYVDSHGCTPLHLAAQTNPDSLRMLLAKVNELHIDVNATDDNNATPLHHATRAPSSLNIRILLDQARSLNIDVKSRNKNGVSALALAAVRGKDYIRVFVEYLSSSSLSYILSRSGALIGLTFIKRVISYERASVYDAINHAIPRNSLNQNLMLSRKLSRNQHILRLTNPFGPIVFFQNTTEWQNVMDRLKRQILQQLKDAAVIDESELNEARQFLGIHRSRFFKLGEARSIRYLDELIADKNDGSVVHRFQN